jgi:uncharacterized surface protein with fasciclin (FAS1) repeats
MFRIQEEKTMKYFSICSLTCLALLSGLPAQAASTCGVYGTSQPTAAVPSTDSIAQAPAGRQTILGWLQDHGDYTTFLNAVQAAGLDRKLTAQGTYTVLAPTDEAFAQLPSGLLAELLRPKNQGLLAQVLDYHIVPGTLSARDIADRSSLQTLDGATAPVASRNGELAIANASVVDADNPAGNGVVDAIDAVLLPPDVVDRLSGEGYDLLAYAPENYERGVVMDSTQRNPAYSGGPDSYSGPMLNGGNGAGTTGYDNRTADDYDRQAGYADTTSFGDSGTYGNSNNYMDRGNFYGAADDYGPSGQDTTAYSPSMRPSQPPAGSTREASEAYSGSSAMDRQPAGAYSSAPYGMNMDQPGAVAAGSNGGNAMGGSPGATCGAQSELEASMRKLWTQHAVWKRDYIIAAIDNEPAAKQAVMDELAQNERDLGQALSQYFGTDAGNRLAALFGTHNQLDAQVIDAAAAHDSARFNQAHQQLVDNAHDIARFLAQVNPNWPESRTDQLMMRHLDTTAAQLQARLNQDYRGDLAAFNNAYNALLDLSDYLSAGIVSEYPQLASAPGSMANGVVMGSTQRNPKYSDNGMGNGMGRGDNRGYDRDGDDYGNRSDGGCCCR